MLYDRVLCNNFLALRHKGVDSLRFAWGGSFEFEFANFVHYLNEPYINIERSLSVR